MIYVRIWI